MIRRRKRCRVQGCRTKTTHIYRVVVQPGLVVCVHLCDEHHQDELDQGASTLRFKPPTPPSHLPHQAPANFALPEKRRKGDTR